MIRNAGGVVTDDEIRSLAISQRKLGTEEIILVHHTDCGMLTFTDDEFRQQIQEETGIKPVWPAETFSDVDEDLRQSLARIKTSPFIPNKDSVRASSTTWRRAGCARSARRSPPRGRCGVGTATTGEHNKRLVRRALEEIYAKGDLELANELIHPDFVDHEPAHPEQPTGPESVKQTVRQLHDTFGDLRFEVQDEIAEGEDVVQLVTMWTPHRPAHGPRTHGQGVRRSTHLHLANRGRPDRRPLGKPG